MNAPSPCLTVLDRTDSIDRLLHNLRTWRIALVVYAIVGVLAAGFLPTEIGAIVAFSGFAGIVLFVFRLKAEIATLQMHRQFRRIAEMRSQPPNDGRMPS